MTEISSSSDPYSCNRFQPPAPELPQQFWSFHAMSNDPELAEGNAVNRMKGSTEERNDVVLARST